jgi:hypothetical protein
MFGIDPKTPADLRRGLSSCRRSNIHTREEGCNFLRPSLRGLKCKIAVACFEPVGSGFGITRDREAVCARRLALAYRMVPKLRPSGRARCPRVHTEPCRKAVHAAARIEQRFGAARWLRCPDRSLHHLRRPLRKIAGIPDRKIVAKSDGKAPTGSPNSRGPRVGNVGVERASMGRGTRWRRGRSSCGLS